MDDLVQLIVTLILIHYLSCKCKTYFIHWHFDDISQTKVQWKHVILIPICGSLSLIFIFFYPSIAKYFVYASVLFSATSCFYLLLQPLFNSLPSLTPNVKISLSLLISFTIILIYLISQTWWTSNIIAIGIAIAIQSFIYVDRIHIPVVLLSIMFFYDIFWVFGSTQIPIFDGKSVMVEAAKTATSLRLPLLIEFYSIFTGGHFLLGLGDVVLPGIFITYSYCIDIFYKTKFFFVTLIGYCCGLLLTILILWKFQVGQPALLYLVPSMFIPFLIYSFFSKTTKAVYNLNLSNKFKEIYSSNPQPTLDEQQNPNETHGEVAEDANVHNERILVEVE